MIRVYATAVGDLLHRGHRRALKQAKALGDYLIVGVLTDEAVAAYKRKPIIPLDERLEGIEELPYVDDVIIQDSIDPTENLMILDPDILTHGDDWGENFPGAEYMRSIGKQVIRTKYYKEQSTTKIIEKIRGRLESNWLCE